VIHSPRGFFGSETCLTVSVGKLPSWLDGGGKSPNEQVLKSGLREML
jgi:hypothetical protein